MSLSAVQFMLCSAPQIENVSICGAERPAPHNTVHVRPLFDRHAPQVRAGAPAAHALLPADRPHIPCDPLRATTAVHCALLAPDDVLLTDILHAPDLRPRRRHIRRLPSGCPNPCCTDDCEMIRFPRTGIDAAVVLPLKRGTCRGGHIRACKMSNWVDCDVAFSEVLSPQPWLVSSTAAIVIHKVIQYHPCPPPTIIHHGILASCQI